MQWSVFSRAPEATVVPVARELGITVVAYSPLGRGMITGLPQATTRLSLLDFRRFLAPWRGGNLDTNLAQVEKVKTIAAEVGVTPAQVALAWLLGRGDDVVPIPGTKRRTKLDDNVRALDVRLGPRELGILGSIAAAGGIGGF